MRRWRRTGWLGRRDSNLRIPEFRQVFSLGLRDWNLYILKLDLLNFISPQRDIGVDRAPERFVRSAARFEMRKFESWPPGLRVWANTDSDMQRFESRRPNQPVRL